MSLFKKKLTENDLKELEKLCHGNNENSEIKDIKYENEEDEDNEQVEML